jgi:hypothetical protein
VYGKGAGIASTSALTLIDCNIANNSAHDTNTAGGEGGGVYSGGGTVTMTGCTVSGNTVYGKGAGIASTSALTLIDCNIANNSAHDSVSSDTGVGGGIWCAQSNSHVPALSLTGCTVSGNVAGLAGGGVYSDAYATMTGCTVSNNQAGKAGGGIYIKFVSLDMTACTVSGNMAALAPNSKGGGIWNDGTLTMTGCTISENVANGYGGGIFNFSNASTPLTLTNCTVYGNAAYTVGSIGIGGGIFNIALGTSTLSNCTVAGNRASFAGGGGAGGGIANYKGRNFDLNNSIVAGSQNVGGDIAGLVSGHNNVIDDPNGAGGLTATNGNVLVSNPRLGTLGDYGGPTQTMVLLPGSPAISAGSTAFIPAGITTDQRGVARTHGNSVDAGAVEAGPATLVVTTLIDENDGRIDPSVGSGTSLREAIAFADADPYGDTIVFATGLHGTLSLSLGALPAITGKMSIAGPGAAALTVDAQLKSRILSVQAGANATISGLTLADGVATGGTDGGGIANSGTLTLNDCTVSSNGADGGDGGGIANSGTLTLSDCPISGFTQPHGNGTRDPWLLAQAG